jgi:hypothetical protein
MPYARWRVCVCAQFPRFYFMSDEELIYILSKSKTPAAIQKALEKCFDNISSLEFKENRDVTAMFSAEGEKVRFGLPTRTHRAIESWLQELEKNMLSSLRTYGLSPSTLLSDHNASGPDLIAPLSLRSVAVPCARAISTTLPPTPRPPSAAPISSKSLWRRW